MAGDHRQSDPGGLGAGNTSNRLPGSDTDRQHRADTAAAAARYLIRTGNGDLLSVLGLDAQQPKVCKGCGGLFVPRTPRQRYCRLECPLRKPVAA